MSYKETDWYSCMTVPVREGIYKTRHRGAQGGTISGYTRFFAHKGKMVWGYTEPTIFLAGRILFPSSQQSREWKGILNGDVPS